MPPETFKDKIVLVGATALGIGDLRNTPFQSGRRLHGSRGPRQHHRQPAPQRREEGAGSSRAAFYEELIESAFIVLFGLVFGFWFSRIKPLYSTISVLLALAAFGWFVYFSFAH